MKNGCDVKRKKIVDIAHLRQASGPSAHSGCTFGIPNGALMVVVVVVVFNTVCFFLCCGAQFFFELNFMMLRLPGDFLLPFFLLVSEKQTTAQKTMRLPSLLPHLLLLLLLCPWQQQQRGMVEAQDTLAGDPTVDGEGDGAEEKKGVEVAQYFTEFARQGPYPYQICEELPGEIGEDPVTATARCIPIETGELEFCANVAYDACMRVISPVEYDEQLLAAHDKRIGLWELEFPALVTTECTDAFKLYFCLLSFPRCEEDIERPGTFLELPLCYDFCVNSHMACIGDPTLSVRENAASFRGRGGLEEGERERWATRSFFFFFQSLSLFFHLHFFGERPFGFTFGFLKPSANRMRE